MVGPFAWESADVTVSETCDAERDRDSCLSDKVAGFEVHYHGGLILNRGVWAELRNEFRRFYFDLNEEP